MIATRLNVDDDEWREMMKKKKKKKRRRERKAKAFIIVVGELGDLSRNKIFSFCRLLFPRTSFFSLLSLLITPPLVHLHLRCIHTSQLMLRDNLGGILGGTQC